MRVKIRVPGQSPTPSGLAYKDKPSIIFRPRQWHYIARENEISGTEFWVVSGLPGNSGVHVPLFFSKLFIYTLLSILPHMVTYYHLCLVLLCLY